MEGKYCNFCYSLTIFKNCIGDTLQLYGPIKKKCEVHLSYILRTMMNHQGKRF